MDLSLTVLCIHSADVKLVFSYFSPENRNWHFMQIVSIHTVATTQTMRVISEKLVSKTTIISLPRHTKIVTPLRFKLVTITFFNRTMKRKSMDNLLKERIYGHLWPLSVMYARREHDLGHVKRFVSKWTYLDHISRSHCLITNDVIVAASNTVEIRWLRKLLVKALWRQRRCSNW